MHALAWISYLPVPFLHLGMARIAPDDRLVRYHAAQGGRLVLATWAIFLVLVMLNLFSDAKWYRTTMGGLVSLIFLVYLVGACWGIVGAMRGRFPRLPGLHMLPPRQALS